MARTGLTRRSRLGSWSFWPSDLIVSGASEEVRDVGQNGRPERACLEQAKKWTDIGFFSFF